MPVRAADAIWVAHTTGTCTMNDTARRLRAQKAHSTDPGYLERMAREEETRGVNPANAAAAEGGSALARREASTETVEATGAAAKSRRSKALLNADPEPRSNAD
jgi:hypothetical protein